VRPGVSYISSAYASELFISVLHHTEKEGCLVDSESILGIVP